MMYPGWQELTAMCAKSIVDDTKRLTELMRDGLSGPVMDASRAVLQAKLQLFEVLVSAYLKDVRDGAHRE